MKRKEIDSAENTNDIDDNKVSTDCEISQISHETNEKHKKIADCGSNNSEQVNEKLKNVVENTHKTPVPVNKTNIKEQTKKYRYGQCW